MNDEDYDEDYYDDCESEEDEESEPLMLQIDKDGKACIKNPSDYIEMSKDDFDLLNGFATKHPILFDKYLKENKK